jgi:tetratricopeptide (TPR) repeat protein
MQTYPPGTRIGQYEIASRPMMGGMGVVYFAIDHGNDGRPVALKTFRPELLPDRAARDRFLREGTAWIELGSHPHIVRCYKVEYIDPTAFLVLELISKEQNMPDASLRSWLIPGRPLPLEQALLFALQIARGMQYATEKIPGFVHRDLKPENILVGADRLPGTNINRLRVTDFGLAVVLQTKSGKLHGEQSKGIESTNIIRGIVGTPLYMAPEQWRREPLGTYTDIYALGCIVYEMLSGERVAQGRTIGEIQAAHCNDKLRPISSHNSVLVREILVHSLSPHTRERYQTWEELTSVLGAAYADEGGESVPTGASGKAESQDERSREGLSYNAIGRAYADIGKVKVATEYLEKALLIAREVGNRRDEAAALTNLGSTYALFGDMQSVIGYFEQALEIAGEIGNRGGVAAVLGNLGNVYLYKKDALRAVSYYEQSLAIKREIGDRHGEGDDLRNLAIAYAELGEVSREVSYLEQALAIARGIGDRRSEVGALGRLGVAYTRLGNLPGAIMRLEQSLEIAREIGDRRGEGLALGDLGIVYQKGKDIAQAIGYHEQSLAINREIGDRREEANELVNLGLACASLGDMSRAIGYHQQARTIWHTIGDINGVATETSIMAALFARHGERVRALSLAEEAALIWSQMGDPRAQVVEKFIAQLETESAPIQRNSAEPKFNDEQKDLVDSVVAVCLGLQSSSQSLEKKINDLAADPLKKDFVNAIIQIWKKEARYENRFTALLENKDEIAIIREILKQLEARRTERRNL